MGKPKSEKDIEQEKYDRMMETVAQRAGFYRDNPQRFVSDCLFSKDVFVLAQFQAILLQAMFHNNFIMYLAARGQGKTMLIALYLVCRCILFPGTKVIVTSNTLTQANEVLLKIQDELMPLSPFLRNEIESCNVGQNKAEIYFKSRSQIKTRTSTENARSARANILVTDEFRQVDKHIVDSVTREFLKAPRKPGYLNKPEYKHLKERNQEIYMSSAYYKSSQAQTKACSYAKDFLSDKKKYFICGLPYQVSIQSDLLMREQVEDQMNEMDFDPISFSMEDECLFYGDTDGSLFKYDDINKRRKIRNALLPLRWYETYRTELPKPPTDGRRILSVDVALMASTKKKKNDAASLFINDLVKPDMYSYHSGFVYGKNFEGLTTDELGIIVMRWFYHYQCTDLVVDTNGLGTGIFDFIIKDQYDSETGETYRALTCVNDDDMAMRCKVPDAVKAVQSVKASASFNNEIAVLLRNGIQNGKVNFLISELEADEPLKKMVKGYDKLTLGERVELKAAYAQTTLAEYELVKLGYETVGGNIKVKEQSGMRKDRYSSIAYSYWCACQLERQLRPTYDTVDDMINKFKVRKASYLRK